MGEESFRVWASGLNIWAQFREVNIFRGGGSLGQTFQAVGKGVLSLVARAFECDDLSL